MLCVGLTVALTTLGWIVAVGVLLTVVGLIADRLTGRPKWTPNVYRRDQERSP